ncbi:hypothetical protein D3C80_1299770 [compost metagenome]
MGSGRRSKRPGRAAGRGGRGSRFRLSGWRTRRVAAAAHRGIALVRSRARASSHTAYRCRSWRRRYLAYSALHHPGCVHRGLSFARGWPQRWSGGPPQVPCQSWCQQQCAWPRSLQPGPRRFRWRWWHSRWFPARPVCHPARPPGCSCPHCSAATAGRYRSGRLAGRPGRRIGRLPGPRCVR